MIFFKDAIRFSSITAVNTVALVTKGHGNDIQSSFDFAHMVRVAGYSAAWVCLPDEPINAALIAEMLKPFPTGFRAELKEAVFEKYRTDLHPINGTSCAFMPSLLRQT